MFISTGPLQLYNYSCIKWLINFNLGLQTDRLLGYNFNYSLLGYKVIFIITHFKQLPSYLLLLSKEYGTTNQLCTNKQDIAII